ncbi:hypothetical protein IscW_ISCW003391 [Ixodes scapularis]|uniref:Uncharacterized protein n=1 Tax=Ixodes scapularis TaxID=6945 RepID=B7PDR5_IXOSC|nr:hypothetical protein IscW_ISCW003391 [Ixodes scapularis]|eukprot:XP_002411014.1 hypothetical protein IscW_ISCW003391 [Ixodes scapularis]
MWAADIDVCPEIPASCPTCSLHVDEILDNICKQNIGEDEEEKLCGDLEVTETFGLHKNHFNDVLSASLRKDCACDVAFGAGHPVHVLANATSFNGIPTLSQLVLNDGVTLLQHSTRNQEELAAALKNCQLEKKMDVGHGDYSSSYEGANVYKQAYVVKTVKYVYPAPSYGVKATSRL